MIRTLRLLPDHQGAKEEGLGLGVCAPAPVQLGEVVKADTDIRVVGTQLFFSY